MAFLKHLKHYAALLYPNNGLSQARINLHCNDNYKLYLIFKDTSESLPSNTFDPEKRIGLAYQRKEEYFKYIDIIRNEKPISVTFNVDSSPPSFVVYCASEPPGDGEI